MNTLANTSFQNTLALVGRMLLAAMFVMAGLSKVTGFEGTVGYIASKGLPLPQLGAVIAILIELGAGLALVFGFRTRAAAFALAGFTLVASFVFHHFWVFPADQQMMQMLLFMKNISVVGGLLMLAAFGPGAYSVDGKK